MATDDEIRQRLTRILKATEWFVEPSVQVDEGVVFLKGSTQTESYKKWAGDLARSTEDVVAVVNRIDVLEPSILDFSPALAGMYELWRDIVHALPWILFALLIVLLFYAAAHLARKSLGKLLRHRLHNPLLRSVAAFTGGLAVFLAGLYLILRVAGLTQLALTVVGGTGLVSIVLGVGFRDITENFLSSILLSWQNPFRSGDLIEVAGVVGYVERMNMRSTVLMTLGGSHVQIPNATIYKSVIRNFTSNPNRREDFVIGIGYAEHISTAQQLALAVVSSHPAVLKDPEPWVLVDNLAPGAVNLRVYFWLDGREHSWLKVKSAVIRLVKRAFQDHGVTLTEGAAKSAFPKEVSVRLLEQDARPPASPQPEPKPSEPADSEPAVAATRAEAGLSSDAQELKSQGQMARAPEKGEDLLNPPVDN
jgi:small-conductance mechanosensitive channel